MSKMLKTLHVGETVAIYIEGLEFREMAVHVQQRGSVSAQAQ